MPRPAGVTGSANSNNFNYGYYFNANNRDTHRTRALAFFALKASKPVFASGADAIGSTLSFDGTAGVLQSMLGEEQAETTSRRFRGQKVRHLRWRRCLLDRAGLPVQACGLCRQSPASCRNLAFA